MIRYPGTLGIVMSWVLNIMLSIVPVDWVIACMVPLYKGKGRYV